MRGSVLVATLLVLSTSARAEFYSGNEIYNFCKVPANKAFVSMYIAGLIDEDQQQSSRQICAPAQSNLGQGADIVCQWLESFPATRHYPAAPQASLALMAAWPCGGQSGR